MFPLGEFLKKVRMSQKLTIRGLARLSEERGEGKTVTASQISNIERGKTDAGYKTIQKVVELLDVPVFFLYGEGPGHGAAVTVISNDEIAQELPVALTREKLVELLLMCRNLSDEQLEAILGVTRVIRDLIKSSSDEKDI